MVFSESTINNFEHLIGRWYSVFIHKCYKVMVTGILYESRVNVMIDVEYESFSITNLLQKPFSIWKLETVMDFEVFSKRWLLSLHVNIIMEYCDKYSG